jgi:hypothetical protein
VAVSPTSLETLIPVTGTPPNVFTSPNSMTSKISGMTLLWALARARAVSIDAASRRRCPAAMALASLNTISGNGTLRSYLADRHSSSSVGARGCH